MSLPEEKIESARAEFSPARGFLRVGIAVVAFVLACAVLNRFLPFPEIDFVSAELRFFRQHQDEFDTVLIGSSRIHHGISPAIFDGIMREAGLPTHTFNFGVSGMFPPEVGYVLERLLNTRPRHLKWVFIELDELETGIPITEASRRALYWHDWKRTSLVLQEILDTISPGEGLSFSRKIGEVLIPGPGKSDARDRFFFHSGLFAKNFTNIGRKIDLTWWSSHIGKKIALPKGLGPGFDGYIPQLKTMSAVEVATYEAGLERAAVQAEFAFVSASTEQAYRQWADEVRKAGATPIFLVPPRTAQVKFGFRPESGLADKVMLFNDAKAYPQLYLSEVRFDSDHLNGTGAEEFTRLVARKFSQLIQEKQIQ
jgi:hypothetical protein